MSDFNCTKCGACCRAVGRIPDFPEPVNEDGSCVHLKEDNTCAIYETRPLICRVDEFYDLCLSDEMSKDEWHEINYVACRTLQLAEEENDG